MTVRLQIALTFGAIAALVAQPLELLETKHLLTETYHVQGIEVQSSKLWLTSVDTAGKRGLLFEFDLGSGRARRSLEIQQGAMFHPGGISSQGESLWIPVAEYRPGGASVIQKRNKRTLRLEYQFAVPDHIGCVAAAPDLLVGANWDARELYVWDHRGKQLRKVANSTGTAVQDLKISNGELVGGGLLKDKSGSIDWLSLPALTSLRSLKVGRTDRGVAYTHEGLAVAGGKLWLAPEDSPSRLFVFRLPGK